MISRVLEEPYLSQKHSVGWKKSKYILSYLKESKKYDQGNLEEPCEEVTLLIRQVLYYQDTKHSRTLDIETCKNSMKLNWELTPKKSVL